MAGPWEDYGGTAEESGPWDDFKKPSTPAATVAPGDVEGRKRQLAEDASATRVRDTSANPLVEGAEGIAQVVKGATAPLSAAPTTLAEAQDVAAGGIKDVALGGLRTVAAPFAPVDYAAARAGESVQDKLLASGVNPTIAAGAATLADMGINIGGSLGVAGLTRNARRALTKAAPAIEKVSPQAATAIRDPDLLKSSRTKAAEATTKGEAAIVATQERAAATRTAAQDGVESARSSVDAARESFESIGEAAKRNIPTKADLKAIAGDDLAETTGAKFKQHFETTRAARKAKADELYDDALGPKAAGDKSTVDVVDDLQEAGKSLSEQARAARGTPNEAEALKRYSDFINTGKMPEGASLRDLHSELIKTRREHRIATRNQEDNIARQLGAKEQSIIASMEEASPGVIKKLEAADAVYASEFAPYFSKGSVTRAIADKDPSTIARNAILPRSKSGKEVDTINRTLELIGDNEPLKKQVAQSHLNSLIDEAGQSANFREAFVKGWERYTNPSGNNNKVLRAAYGKDYESINSIVNQFRNSKPKDIDSLVASMVKGAEKEGAARIKGLEESAKFATKAASVEAKVIKKKIQEDVQNLLGKSSLGSVTNRLQSIGSGVLMSGSALGDVRRASTGGLFIVGAKALARLLETARGRSVWKAIMRSTPGTAQAAANARIAEKLLSSPGSSEESN